VVSIKTFLESPSLSWAAWARSYDIHLAVSNLQNENIVKIVGYVAHEVQPPSACSLVMSFFKRKECRVLRERKYFWVEEYLPNGSLDKIIDGMIPLKYLFIAHPLVKFFFTIIFVS
jgi:L1 cell adhesion molecule like protein